MMNNAWTVTTSHQSLDRKWGIRFEYVGSEYVLAISLKPFTPAARIVIFGCSLLFGRIRPQVKTTSWRREQAIDDIAKSLEDNLKTEMHNHIDQIYHPDHGRPIKDERKTLEDYP